MSANSKLKKRLISLHQQEFTGVLTITSQDNRRTWEMFFYRGTYLWTEGGHHPNRSWRRNFRQHCPGINTKEVVLSEQPEMRSPYYCLLNVLLQRKIVKREQAKALIINHAQEILFDLLQAEHNGRLNYAVENTSSHYLLKAGFNLSLAFVDLKRSLFQSQTAWTAWGSKGLASCSPHHAPLLHHNLDLRQQVPNIIFVNMSRLLNGKRTLRDLAVKMDKNVLDVTCGIVPYFFKGYLRLLEIPDLSVEQVIK